MRRLAAVLASLAFLSSARAEPIPCYAVSLTKYAKTLRPSEGATRLRISIATESAHGERSVRIGDVLLCKAGACFRAHTPSFVDMSNTSAGMATVIADVVIPTVTITDLYFIDPSNGPAIAGHLKFNEPLMIEKGFHGLELLISIRKQQTAGKASFIPAQAGSSYFNPESQLVHYLPSTRTVAKLPLGVVLTIPAGALLKPQVFHVGVHDSGKLYPKIDIYPYLKLHKPVIVEAPAIPGGTSAHEMIVPAYIPEEKHPSGVQNSALPDRTGRVTLHATRVIEPSSLEDSAIDSKEAPPDTARNTRQARGLTGHNLSRW